MSRKPNRIKDLIFNFFVFLAAFFTIASLIMLVGYILYNGLGALQWEFFIDLMPSIVSTLLMILISVAIAVPIGIATAIYLNEYATKKRVVAVISFAIDSLAGIPSILYGLFGMVFFVVTLNLKWSLLSGALTIAIMILPTIVRVTQESLQMVPDSFREGSFALGASKVVTLGKIVLPTAIKGILTAVILSIGRIVGETAAVYLTAGTVDRMPTSIMDSGRTLAVHLYLLAKEAIGPDAFKEAFGTATLLIIIILILVILSQLLFKGRDE